MGGVQFSTYFLAEHLMNEKSADVRIFFPSEGPFSILCQKSNIPYRIYNAIPYISTSISLFNDKIRIPNPIAWVYNIWVIFHNCLKIKSQLNQYAPNLVVTKGLLNHFSSGLACKILNIPVIWHVQDLISQRYYGSLVFIFNQLGKKIPNHIICDGKIIKDYLKGPLSERSSVVLNGIKTEELERCLKSRDEVRKELSIPANAYVIGNLARITPWKGQELLLRAFIEYSSHNKNAYLILAGSPLFDNDKYQRLLKKLISKNDLDDRVIMPGYRTDLKEIFSAMDLFMYSAIEKDTSPLALLSALSAGLPVIIFNIKSLKEISDLSPAIDVLNQKDLKQLLILLKKYENNNIRIDNGRKNLETAIKYFDISKHSKNMLKCFNSVLSYRYQ